MHWQVAEMLGGPALIELRAPPAGRGAHVALIVPWARGRDAHSCLKSACALSVDQRLPTCLQLLFCMGSLMGTDSPLLPTQLGGTSGRGTRGAAGCSGFCRQQLPCFSYTLGWQDQLSFAIFKLSVMLWWRLPAPHAES